MQENNMTQAPEGFEIVTRHIVMERDLNAFGNLFGGVLLAWLDEGSALYVMETIGYADFVTVSMNDVNFREPVRRGDAIVIYCSTQRTGKSSITVNVRAYVHEPVTAIKREVINCQVTFVCLQDKKPFAYFETEEYRTWQSRD